MPGDYHPGVFMDTPMLTHKHLFTLMAINVQSNSFPLEGYIVDFLIEKGLVRRLDRVFVTTRGKQLLDRMKGDVNECLLSDSYTAAA